MITEISSDLETFKTLRFGSGLNILLAKRHNTSSARDTRNGTGKTSFVELFQYLLSEKRNANDDFHKPELIGASYSMQLNEGGKQTTIARKSGPSDEATKDGEPIVPADLRAELALKWFGLSKEDTAGNYSPKFGALLS